MADKQAVQATTLHDGVLWVPCRDGWRTATPREAGAEIERLRKIAAAAERVCGNDMAGIVEDDAWAALREALGMEVCPT